MKGSHPVTRRELIEFAIVGHYRENLKVTGDRQLAARLVVLDIIAGAAVPPERRRAHAQIVSDILTKYEADSFESLVADMEQDDGR